MLCLYFEPLIVEYRWDVVMRNSAVFMSTFICLKAEIKDCGKGMFSKIRRLFFADYLLILVKGWYEFYFGLLGFC